MHRCDKRAALLDKRYFRKGYPQGVKLSVVISSMTQGLPQVYNGIGVLVKDSHTRPAGSRVRRRRPVCVHQERLGAGGGDHVVMQGSLVIGRLISGFFRLGVVDGVVVKEG
jgi:hypothetical protein